MQDNVINKLRLDATNDRTKVKEALNRAYYEAVVETEAKIAKTTLTLTANTDNSTLASTVGRVKRMTLTSGGVTYGPLIEASLDTLLRWRQQGGGSAVAVGTVTHYTLLGLDRLEWYPTPQSADTVNIWYAAFPTALSADGDLPILPEPYATECLENGGLYWMAVFLKDPDALGFKSDYEDAKRKLRAHLNRMRGAGPEQLELVGGRPVVPRDPSTDRGW